MISQEERNSPQMRSFFTWHLLEFWEALLRPHRGFPRLLLMTGVGNLTRGAPGFSLISELPGPCASSLCWAIIAVLNHSLPISIQGLPMDIFMSHQEVCSDQPSTNFLSYLQQVGKAAPGTTSSHSAVTPNGLITRLPAPPSQGTTSSVCEPESLAEPSYYRFI